ncbi:MAG: serine/threonine protein kinase [Desulfuromonas sp.]|nr:serine/threonine protein kinase [Desulfuromonas sp.]
MRLRELCGVGRSPDLPLRLQLPGSELELRAWLRVLPGRRYVGLAEWQGRLVLAKLLVGRKAAQQFRREQDGIDLLVAGGINTPPLLASGFASDAGGWLLFDYLDGARSLGDAWYEVERQSMLSDRQRELLGPALEVIGTLHRKGLWQQDLHLDNLLCHDGQLYLVDGGSMRVEMQGRPLSLRRVLQNLGIFFAQLSAEIDPFIDELLESYRRSNDTHAFSAAALQGRIGKVRRWRLRDYLRKAGRDCSLFHVQTGPQGLRAVRREEVGPLAPLLNDPDHCLAQSHLHKAGGSSTVARVDLAGRLLLVKRYNIKGFTHYLRRCWRPSRAWHSWREGNRLMFLGIPTPKPLAVIERRNCWLRDRAYLVTEYLEGEDIISCFRSFHEDTPPLAQLRALDGLFAALLRERISHGDMKGHNLIWHDGQWALIDLDGMRRHCCQRSFARAYARDRARFLKNWPSDSALYRLLDQRLPRVPGTPIR